MTQAVNTPRYGNAFQARIFWTYAARLLSSTTAVRRVGFESGPRGFDDVWVEYDASRGPLDQFGNRLHVERFQCKWHVSNGTFTHVDLTDPKYSGASTFSLLQRARDAYKSDVDGGHASRIRLMTNHRLQVEDVLYKLVEQQHHTLRLDDFFQGTTKASKFWQARELWKQHLNVDDAGLRAFCARLALSSVSESLDDFRQRMDEALHAYGLKPSEPGIAATVYDQLPYDWLGQGRHEFDAKLLRDVCGDEGLLAEQASPPPKVFGVKSFEHSFDRLEARCDDVLNLLPEFAGRYLKQEFAWDKDLLPKLTAFVRSAAQSEQRLRLAMDTHLTLAFAVGTVLDTKSGKTVELEQRVRGIAVIWASDDVPVDPAWPDWKFDDVDLGTGGAEIAVAISITRPTEQQVRDYVAANPSFGRLVVANLVSGASQAAVLNGAHADQLADKLANHLKDARAVAGGDSRAALHLFMAAPYSFSFFLGRHIKVLKPVTMYEFDFDGERGGNYVASMALPSAF